MLYAELRGKLGRDGSRAHDRAEDLLTSTAFQLLRYVPADAGLLVVLRKVRWVTWDDAGKRAVVEHQPTGWPVPEGTTGYEAVLWPPRDEYGEPDVVVTLMADGRPVGRLLIETKLYAGKSGEDDPDDPPEEERSRDQLRRYWQRLRKDCTDGVRPLGVVYLTAHAIHPVEDLTDSLRTEPGDWLGWLSWRDVWAVTSGLPEPAARDLAAILAHKGLKYFTGFRRPDRPLLLTAGGFWRSRWFRPLPGWSTPPRCGFWASTESADGR
jgi:hypothetical protein